MSITSIKLDGGISDPEFVEISTNARKRERAHLLGLLRIFIGQLKRKAPPRKKFIHQSSGGLIAANYQSARATSNEPLNDRY